MLMPPRTAWDVAVVQWARRKRTLTIWTRMTSTRLWEASSAAARRRRAAQASDQSRERARSAAWAPRLRTAAGESSRTPPRAPAPRPGLHRGAGQHALLDHLICPYQDRLRDRQPERPRSLEVDDQLERGGLLDGQVRGLGAFEDLVHISGRAAERIDIIRPIGQEATGVDKLFPPVHRWQPRSCRKLHDLL